MSEKQTSIRDVARSVGVSPTTVSLVLNRSPIPSASTREKVLHAVKELNYEPDHMFRQAVQQRRLGQRGARAMTQTIGFLSAETIFESAQQQDGYYSRVVAGIHRALERQQYHLMWKAQPTDALELPVMVTEGRVDGLLIEGNFPVLLRDLLAKRLPVAFIDRTYPELPANSVMPHIEQAVSEIMAYLWELGHREIITFQHAGPAPHVQAYLRGFHGFFAEKAHPLAHAHACQPREITPQTHARVMAEYAREIAALRPRPTALVSWDVYACSLLVEFQRLGLRVPQDISLVGMDDWIGARLATPQLTTYRFPMEELGRSATELLIEQIKDRNRPVRHLVINGQIIERASCARAQVTGIGT